ncbi:MAG: amidohydrolase family protein [Planctomycetes bacterium]|nr:amidohydrolase family protein [Planctomycetota bacterium]
MATHLLQPDCLVLHDRLVVGAAVEVEDGVVTGVRDAAGDGARRLAGTLLPGFVDLQVNGAGGRSVPEATREALDHIAEAIARTGTSGFLPTLITAPWDQLMQQAGAVAEWIENYRGRGAQPLGIHLEGPFLVNPGAHDAAAMVDPTPERIDQMLTTCRGRLRLVTLAPSRRGAAEAVARLRSAGVSVALGHGVGSAGVVECVAAGATVATHLFNAMGPCSHRDPGMALALLDRPEVSCSLILDGYHLNPTIARQVLRSLGAARAVLISDSVAAAGMPEGTYRLGDKPVVLRGGAVRTEEGTLAGSALTMFAAADQLLQLWPEAGPWTVHRVAAHNPARLIGARGFGSIEVGARAQFNLLGADGSWEVVAG